MGKPEIQNGVAVNSISLVKSYLKETRDGNYTNIQSLVDAIFYSNPLQCIILSLLQPEDKEWLLKFSCVKRKCIVLAGMYKSWRSWEEEYLDDDTGEELTISRCEALDSPLFDRKEEEAKRLFAEICEGSHPNYSEELVDFLSTYTPFDYTLIIT